MTARGGTMRGSPELKQRHPHAPSSRWKARSRPPMPGGDGGARYVRRLYRPSGAGADQNSNPGRGDMPARAEATSSAERGNGEPAHALLLARAFADGSPAEIAYALGVIARARGMTEVARRSGLAREALYRALSRDGDPKLSTLLRVTQALDIRLEVKMSEDGKAGGGPGHMR